MLASPSSQSEEESRGAAPSINLIEIGFVLDGGFVLAGISVSHVAEVIIGIFFTVIFDVSCVSFSLGANAVSLALCATF